MRIIIVGAGLGGLTAALCFARDGHSVEVLEHRLHLSDTSRPGEGGGGALNVRPSASRVLHALGLAPDLAAISDDTPAVVHRSACTGRVAGLARAVVAVAVDVTPDPDWSTHRGALVALLHRRAVEAGAAVTFGATVVSVNDDPDGNGPEWGTAAVTLWDGTPRYADLVLAADGIRSTARWQFFREVDPALVDPVVSDLTLFGVRLERAEMAGVPELEALAEQAWLNVYMGQDCWVVSRFNSKLQSLSAFFGVRGEKTEPKYLWDRHGDIDLVRERFRDACPELRAVLQRARSCDRWRLAELPDLPRWTSRIGRIALLGDSAHGMQPNAAHGYTQTVEDIGVLAHLVSAHEDAAAAVPEILTDWQRICKPRAERIKAWAHFNGAMFASLPPPPAATPTPSSPSPEPGREGVEEAIEWQTRSLRHTRPDAGAHFNSAAFLKWTQAWDAVEEARNYLRDKKASRL
ncbi:hypothetical protein GGR56DRAFT_678260 [Xylariaceae sp. FL0804]|nr:hypothetical protein GGR56DRAFT_678260 [Xylariaceae sp. FL0804]